MRARGLATNSTLAFVGDLATKAGALLVLLAAARLFSTQEFALLATALACAGLLTTALDLGAGTLLTRDGAGGAEPRGALFRGLVEGRVPLALFAGVSGLLVGTLLGDPVTAVMVVAFSLSGALALSVLGLYRSCRDIAPEALQRIEAAGLAVGSAVVVGLVAPRADVLLAALTLTTVVTLTPLVLHAPRIADLSHAMSARTALRRAVPIGLLALATVAYYRSGTIALAAFSTAHATATFSVAATLGFGLLMLPNAITTALLPRLSIERELDGLVACARTAIASTLAIAVPLSLSASLVAPVAIPALLGPTYAQAAGPFAVICLGIPLISVSGVIGTSLLALGHLRVLGVQVAVSLAVNVLALALLVPPLGAVGAAIATVTCESVGLVLLVLAALNALPGLIQLRRHPISHRVEASGTARL